MTTTPETLETLAGQDTTELLNYDDHHPRTMVSVPELDEEDNGQIVLVWHEGLEFHAERVIEDGEVLLDDTYETHEKAGNALAQAVGEYLKGFTQVTSVESAPHWLGDDVTNEVALEIVLEIPGGLSATVAAAQRTIWPVEAALFNITDPGTFGTPYIFDRVLEILKK